MSLDKKKKITDKMIASSSVYRHCIIPVILAHLKQYPETHSSSSLVGFQFVQSRAARSLIQELFFFTIYVIRKSQWRRKCIQDNAQICLSVSSQTVSKYKTHSYSLAERAASLSLVRRAQES